MSFEIMRLEELKKKDNRLQIFFIILMVALAILITILIFPILKRGGSFSDFCLTFSFIMIFIFASAFAFVYGFQVYMNHYLQQILINDNNFRNLHQKLSSFRPYLEFGDVKISFMIASKYSPTCINLNYSSIQRLKLTVEQNRSQSTWVINKAKSNITEQQWSFLLAELINLSCKKFQIFSIDSYTRIFRGICVSLRLGEYDTKEFFWFINHFKELFQSLESGVLSLGE